MNNNFFIVIMSVYVIVYIVLKIYDPLKNDNINNINNDNIEEYSNHITSGGIQTETNLNQNEVDKFLEELKKKDELFLKQEEKQNLQNREISLIKQKVDDFRNDLLVLRTNEKETLENNISRDDLEDEEEENENNNMSNNMSNLNNNSSINSNNVPKKSNISGKSYNLNFNINEE